MGFPGGSDSKESACNAGDLGSIRGVRGSPGEGNSYPLQYCGLENFIDRGAWQATVHRVAKLDTTELLSVSLFIVNLQCCIIKCSSEWKEIMYYDFTFSIQWMKKGSYALTAFKNAVETLKIYI